MLHHTVFIDTTFGKKITTDNQNIGLFEVKTKNITLLKKPSYYGYAKDKKGNYPYHILNTFTKVTTDNFLHMKTEIYGDSLINERICKAINLIEKIQRK